jgi:hypothetical protein
VYKFYVTINSTTRQVYPKNADKLSIVTDEESGQIFKRRKLSGNPMFCGDDFKFFYSIETSYSRCSTVTFDIQKKCSGAYSSYWQGTFGMNNGKWSLDKGTVEFEIQTQDDYTLIFNNSKTAVNILNLSEKFTVSATISGYNFEFGEPLFTRTTAADLENVNGCYYREYIQSGSEVVDLGPGKAAPDLSILVDQAFIDDNYPSSAGWVPYYAIYYDGGLSGIHQVEIQFIREKAETPNDAAGAPVEPSGSGWTNMGPFEKNGFTFTRWSRAPFGGTISTYLWDTISGCDLKATFEISIGTLDTFDRNRSFNQAMEYMADELFGLYIVSDFFSLNGDDTYPSNDAYTQAKDNLASLLIAQKSDIIDPYSSEPAKKGELTFEDLQEIWKIFNCQWKIIDGNIRVEHISYWENEGLLDLTLSPYNTFSRNCNSYEYERESLPKYEQFEFMEESFNADFVGLPIIYDSICVNQDKDSNRKILKVNVTTDISYIRIRRDAVAPEGFVLIARSGTDIITEAGKISGVTLPNNHLSWANLHYNYFRWNRVLDTGIMNGVSTPFFSAIKTKKQIPITIPYCCLDIDDNSRIKTFLGTGILLTMEENLYSGTTKIEVIHDIGELAGSFDDRQFDDSFDLSFR